MVALTQSVSLVFERKLKLTITVERDRSVVVHAPESPPEETIREIVESKRRSIMEKARRWLRDHGQILEQDI